MADDDAANSAPVRKKVVGRPFVKGQPSANPSGRPKKLVEIEQMLDAEHRTVENMRAVFTRLKELAMGELAEVRDKEGNVVGVELEADSRFMALYLDRILGKVKDAEDLEELLRDAPEEALRWFAKLN